MARNQMYKYVWLVKTIYDAKRISFEEINWKWLDSDLSEGLEIPLRTFHKWRAAAEEIFGINIECDRKDGYRYYIENREDIKGNSIQNWMIDTISVSNMLVENIALKDRILLENVPSGNVYLSPILSAMKSSKTIEFVHQSYWKSEPSVYTIDPYCVKIFRQRWYVVGFSHSHGEIRIFALDRIREVKILDTAFVYPKDFCPELFFDSSFGVIVMKDMKIEDVRLKVSALQANYLRSLPLHESQAETERNEDYSIFAMQIRPTWDFQQEILRNADEMEILEPLWLRKEIAGVVKRMWDKYEED